VTGPSWDGSGVDPWLPDRLAAESRITAAERKLYNAWWGSFSDYLVRVKRSVLGSGVVDPNGVWKHTPAWAQAMTSFVQGPVRDVLGIGYRSIFGADYLFDARPHVTQYLADVHNRMVRTPDEVYSVVASQVARGAAAGASIATIADQVSEVLTANRAELWASRAVTVARTESISALNAGRTDAFEEMADALGGDFEQMWLCVAPDTPVIAQGAVAAARRHYKGPLVRIRTAAGRTLSVTPEHRVLTGRGWLPAHAVDERDHLLQIVGVEPSRTPHVEHVPPQLGQLVDAAMAAEPVKVRTMPGPVHLDRQMSNGEIEVVPVDRHLAARLQAGLPQRGGDLFLAHADALGVVGMLPRRDKFACSLGHRLTQGGATCSVRTRHLTGQGLRVAPGCAHLARSTAVSNGHACLDEHPEHRRLGTAMAPRQLAHAGTGGVLLEDRRPVEVSAALSFGAETLRTAGLLHRLGTRGEPAPYGVGAAEQFTSLGQTAADSHEADRQRGCDLGRRVPGAVAPDQVVDVHVLDWDAHVYDLSTVTGWYAADGLIIHNSTLDNRTREDHAAADGQRVPVGEPFIVGGESLEFPGDPAGSPEQVINCRCSTVLVRPGEDVDMTGRGQDDWDEWWAGETDTKPTPAVPPAQAELKAAREHAAAISRDLPGHRISDELDRQATLAPRADERRGLVFNLAAGREREFAQWERFDAQGKREGSA
jgi:hypothetical protein